MKKEEKLKKDNKVKKEKKPKKQKENGFLQTIKKKWIVDGTKTTLLVLIIIALFIGIRILMDNLQLTPIDLTQEKIFTLTEQSKEQVKNIENEVNIYFIGYSDNDLILDLARQYNKVNSKIKVETATSTTRPDLVEKYGIETGSEGIIVENGERYKVLSSADLYTYDSTTYETINMSEEKLTAAIKSVVTEDIPKVYFLTGYTQFTLQQGMYYLGLYLENEINEIHTIDLLTTSKVPEDCDTLFITTPNKDFDDITTNAIMEYINKGGNILWLNAATQESASYANVNKILAVYGVNPFESGIIRETNISKMISGSPDIILPDIENSQITSGLASAQGVIFINATKINLVDEEALGNLKVNKTDLIYTSEDSYFRKDFNVQIDSRAEDEEKGKFLVGALLEKTLTEANKENGIAEVKSKLVIYGENYFTSDYQLTETSQYPMVQYRQNKDLVLNSIAYLTDRQEDITIRKTMTSITYSATETENRVILAIITLVPICIISLGIVVWTMRRRKK